MFRSPTGSHLPDFQTIVGDLPQSPRQIARHLGITERTLRKYLRRNDAPRPVLVALFWETRWGRSAADCEAAAYGALQASYAQAMKRQNAELQKQIDVLVDHLDQAASGAANSPVFRVGGSRF